jgi:hypothetical protein
MLDESYTTASLGHAIAEQDWPWLRSAPCAWVCDGLDLEPDRLR